MTESALALGIDGGATHTRAVVLEGSGKQVGAGQADGSNPLVVGFERAAERIVAASRQAARSAGAGLTHFDAACFGLAGIGRTKDRERMWALLSRESLADGFEMDHDAAVALYGATGGAPGVITIAGTGAMSFGMDSAGNRARADGWGRLLGDEGSGFDLATSSLRATARALEGRGPETLIAELVLAATGAADLDQLATWLYDTARTNAEIAALAECALGAARHGDKVAVGLVRQAAADLAGSTAAVSRQLWPEGAPVTVSYGGGLLTSEGELRTLFVAAVRSLVPRAEVLAPRRSAAFGAALRALELLSHGA